MRKKLLVLCCLSALLFINNNGYGQKVIEKKADKVYEQQAYINAIKIYEKLASKGYMNADMLRKLGNSYYFNGKLIEANRWYTELFEGKYRDKEKEIIPSEYYYRYAQTLRSVENYSKAEQMIEVFAKLEKEDSRVRLFKATKQNYLEDLKDRSNRYELENVSINTPYSDFGGVVWGNQFIYTSARETNEKHGKVIHEWTNESYTSLFRSRINIDGSYEQPQRLLIGIENSVNDASAVFTSDGKTMYFTRNNTSEKGKQKINKDRYSLLKIYRATLSNDNQWENIVQLPINSDDFNTANPALTPDGKWLYFSSDRDESIGQSDIFRVEVYTNGDFGTVENLGFGVNTEGRETFPFISDNNVLFFSSDGHPGFGGLDVFATQINPDGSLGVINNVGAPINSSADDFSFTIDTNTNQGYISSNRVNGVGGDDIYAFKERICYQSIQGTVSDFDSKEPLVGAKVTLYDSSYQTIAELYTNAKGYYKVENLLCEGKYRIKVEQQQYNTEEVVSLLTDEMDRSNTVDVILEKTEKIVTKEDDLFKELNLRPIYFDFDKSDIRPDAELEIMKVIEVLESYPSMKIDVRSHTDTKGNSNYNLKLSNNRANSTIDWIISKGIDSSRLTGKGYGESDIKNNCDKGVPCSDLEHQVNRRSEFIITDL